mgnify:CR=1 FL=1|jgi:signal peptidase II
MSPRASALLLAVAVALVDRVSKIWIEKNVSMWDTIVVIPGLFQIVHTQNRGIVFGFLSDSDGLLRPVIVVAVAAVVLTLAFVYFWRLPQELPAGQKYTRTALALILGGAGGNLYDRLVKGGVTDFLDFHFGGYHWPAFNVADSAITAGACLLLLDFALAQRREGSVRR